MPKLKYCIIIYCILFSLIQAQEIRPTYIDSLKALPALSSGQWSLYAEYCDNGKTVLDYNSSVSLAPASGLKVFTTSAALYYLGENFKYETDLYITGKTNKKGVMRGDVIIRGSGDPCLGSDFVKGSLCMDSLLLNWTEALKDAGIKKIEGRIIADESLFKELPLSGSWYWDDMGNYYGAPVNALCFADNTYKVFFRPDKNSGNPAKIIRTEPPMHGLCFRNYMLTGPAGSGDNGIIYCAPGSGFAELRGTIPAGVEEFSIKGAIPNPAAFAARKLKETLTANKIKVTGDAISAGAEAHQYYECKTGSAEPEDKNPGTPEKLTIQDYAQYSKLSSVLSPELKNIVYMTNKRSNNLYTEQLLRTMSANIKGYGSEEKGIECIYDFLSKAGTGRDGILLSDGCGLSRSDMITARVMAKLFSFNYHQPYFSSFYNSLEIAGDPDDIGYHQKMGAGTIIAKNVRLKSGLISRVRSHSGYVRTRSGRMISFSFIANNFSGTYDSIDEFHKEIMIRLAGLE